MACKTNFTKFSSINLSEREIGGDLFDLEITWPQKTY